MFHRPCAYSEMNFSKKNTSVFLHFFSEKNVKALRPELGMEAGLGSSSVCGAAAGESRQPLFLYFDFSVFLYFPTFLFLNQSAEQYAKLLRPGHGGQGGFIVSVHCNRNPRWICICACFCICICACICVCFCICICIRVHRPCEVQPLVRAAATNVGAASRPT